MAGQNSFLQGHTGNQYQLRELIGTGGEGSVYDTNVPGMVAKLYDTSKPGIQSRIPELQRKITYMVTRLQMDVVSKASGNCLVTWPLDVLYENGAFVGYLMRKIDGAKSFQLVQRGNSTAAQVIPGYNWKKGVQVAENLAKVVRAMHANNIVVGDLNNNNILVYPNCEVVLVDTDSFDIRTDTGEHFKCKVGREGYLPPELVGKNLAEEKNYFTRKSDEFALAVHIFLLLMGNNHPFNVKVEDTSVSSEETNPDYNITVGNCPSLRYIPGCTLPVGIPYLHKMFPAYIVKDFEGTFGYQLDPNSANYYTDLGQVIYNRTSADVWYQHLHRFREEDVLAACSRNSAHYHLKGKRCELCEAENRKQVQLQKTMSAMKTGAAAYTAPKAASQSAPKAASQSASKAASQSASKSTAQSAGTSASQPTSKTGSQSFSSSGMSGAAQSVYGKPHPTVHPLPGEKVPGDWGYALNFLLALGWIYLTFVSDERINEILVSYGLSLKNAEMIHYVGMILSWFVVPYLTGFLVIGGKKQKLEIRKSVSDVVIRWETAIPEYAIAVNKKWIAAGNGKEARIPLSAFPPNKSTEVMLVRMENGKPKRESWNSVNINK